MCNGKWVHDDPENDPPVADYAWIRCRKPGGWSSECAEPDLVAEPTIQGYLCRHCNTPIRLHNGIWVHDDPDEDPTADDYGWAT